MGLNPRVFRAALLNSGTARAKSLADAVISALRDDNATLDARLVERAIEAGELKERLLTSESERRRLAQMQVATPRG